MAHLFVGKIDPDLIQRLRERAAQKGRSIDEEHREILRQALVEPDAGPENLARVFGELFGSEHGVEISDPRDRAFHDAIKFDR